VAATRAGVAELGDVDLATFCTRPAWSVTTSTGAAAPGPSSAAPPGSSTATGTGRDEALGRGIARLLHLDDQERIDAYRDCWPASPSPPRAEPSTSARPDGSCKGCCSPCSSRTRALHASLDDRADHLWQHPALRAELLELLPLLEEQIVHLHQPLGLLQPVPLQVHAHYTREEILAAFGASTVTEPLYHYRPASTGTSPATDLLFVTLQKTEKDYSPTTRYLDYAISDSSSTGRPRRAPPSTATVAKAYIQHAQQGRNVALFIRPAKSNASRLTLPYFCAGLASYVEHGATGPCRSPGASTTHYQATSSRCTGRRWRKSRQLTHASA
jgi:hypothetical protein